MTDTTTPLAYDHKMARLQELARRINEILTMAIDPVTPEEIEMIEAKAKLDAEVAELIASPCHAMRPTPNGGTVDCTRSTGHADDHLDENAGIGWANDFDQVETLPADPVVQSLLDALCDRLPVDGSGDTLAAFKAVADYVDELRGQIHRTQLILDRVGVPRARLENTLVLHQRANLFVDRLSKRLHGQVENNMILHHAIRDALASMVGSPNAGSLRIKAAIEVLRGVLPGRRSPGGIHLS